MNAANVARVFGLFLLLSGIIGTAVALLSIVDPVASKMTDDGDPFVAPPSLLSSFFILLCMSVGAFLVWRSGRKPPASA